MEGGGGRRGVGRILAAIGREMIPLGRVQFPTKGFGP